ncbi:MAG: biotin--[acetyl-CoA-carboxylase] ligase [Anaerolineae bacterium]
MNTAEGVADGLASYRRGQGWLGRDLRYIPTLPSTNDHLLQLAEAGAEAGLVVLAEAQTAGRGRGDRRWFAPPGTALLMSMLFRPQEPFGYHALRTTMVVGLALLESVQSVTGLPVTLKWPNDLILEEDGWWKLAGMLSEVGGAGSDFLVVGVGLNVNVTQAQLTTLAPRAMSLMARLGRPVDRVALLDAFLERTEELCGCLEGGWDPLPAWRERLAWLGQAVEVRTPTEVVRGVAETVDDKGALVLRTLQGGQRCFSAGDVSLRMARSG